MPFGMRPAGWAYASSYAYPYAGLPYPVWPWGEAEEVAGVAAGAGGSPGQAYSVLVRDLLLAVVVIQE